MNHSDDFWRLVQSLCPDFKERRDWLKTKGSELYRYQI
jgi:predicted metal-dependent hydrolase